MDPNSESSFFQIMSADDDFTHRLILPLDFVRKHVETLYQDSKLKTICSGETWEVKIEQLTNLEGKPCYFTNGWSDFANDARLDEGECVVFWFDTNDSTFDVAVYEIDGSQKTIWKRDHRVKSEPLDVDSDDDVEDQDGVGDERSMGSDDWKTDETQTEAEYDNSLYPKFEAVLNCSLNRHIQMNFAEAAGLLSVKSVTLEYPPKDRYWSVLLRLSLSNHQTKLYMQTGWGKFCKENGLHIGDTCSFVFNEAKNVIQVQRIKTNSNSKTEDVRGKKRKRAIVKKPAHRVNKLSSESSSRYQHKHKGPIKSCMTYRRAKDFMSRNTIFDLSFVSYMHSTYITESRALHLPVAIMRKNFQNEMNTIRLCVSNRKTWYVKSHNNGKKARLGAGWSSFRKENNIKVGDACVFELNKSDPCLWNVTIFRN